MWHDYVSHNSSSYRNNCDIIQSFLFISSSFNEINKLLNHCETRESQEQAKVSAYSRNEADFIINQSLHHFFNQNWFPTYEQMKCRINGFQVISINIQIQVLVKIFHSKAVALLIAWYWTSFFHCLEKFGQVFIIIYSLFRIL